jgi:rhamnosyltransferase
MSAKLSSNNKTISVFVPTFNGEKYIAELIEAVLNQELPDDYKLEFLITDSGSKDKTVEIIKNNYIDRVIFDEIPNDQYGHGKTRQRAAVKANGKYILFLSQDATPSNYRWLIGMIEPFLISEKIGCVFGRQIPRPDSVPTIKREVASVFGGLGAPDSLVLHRNKSLVDGSVTNTLNTFFSDVNSAIRKDLVEKIPFRDVNYAEDQALAEDMQKAGYLKAYSPQGAVWHSNEYTFKEYYHRKFDEYIGLQESTDYKMQPSLKSVLAGWVRPSIEDIKFTWRDQDYNKRAKIKYTLLSFLYNISEKRGRYDALRYYSDADKRNNISLESRRKNK